MTEERDYTTQPGPWVQFHHDPADVEVHGESIIGAKVTISDKDGTRGEYVIYDVAEIQRTAEITKLEYKLRPIKEFFHFGPDDAEVKHLLQNLLQRQPPLWKLPDDPFDASGWQRPSAPVLDEKRNALPRPATIPPFWAADVNRTRRPRRHHNQPNRQGTR